MPGMEVTAQSNEPLEGIVDRVVGGGCIDAVINNRAKEKLNLATNEKNGL